MLRTFQRRHSVHLKRYFCTNKFIDHYRILMIPYTANKKEIREAYRRLAKIYHPDLHEGTKVAEQKFSNINVAYETLSNKDSKSAYDYENRERFINTLLVDDENSDSEEQRRILEDLDSVEQPIHKNYYPDDFKQPFEIRHMGKGIHTTGLLLSFLVMMIAMGGLAIVYDDRDVNQEFDANGNRFNLYGMEHKKKMRTVKYFEDVRREDSK